MGQLFRVPQKGHLASSSRGLADTQDSLFLVGYQEATMIPGQSAGEFSNPDP